MRRRRVTTIAFPIHLVRKGRVIVITIVITIVIVIVIVIVII